MQNKINISKGKQEVIVYVLLAIITLAVFWQVNQFDFISLDDNVYVTENSHIKCGITPDCIRWAFTTRYFDLWTPLVWISYIFDYKFYGLKAGGYHVTNLILHILSTVLLFWLLNRMTGAIWKSAFVAAFFALHPMRVESVAWIAERKDVLSAFFWMLTLCLYVYYTEKPVIKRYLFVLFCFICGLMSKPMVISLPVIMILLDYWPLGRFQLQKGNVILWQLREKTLFFILSLALATVTLYNPNGAQPKLLSLSDRIVNATVAFLTYLGKTFWPHDSFTLFAFSGQPTRWEFLVSSLLIIIVSFAVIATVKRLPYLFIGWLWYAITIGPVIGIMQIGLFGIRSISDRYTYLPSIGIAIIIAWGIPSLIKNEYIHRKILFPAGIVILALLAVLTWKQCGYWRNSFELANHSLEITKNNNTAHALAYLLRGRAYFDIQRYEQALKDFSEVIRLVPDCANFYYNRGFTYSKLGQQSRAIEDYNEAIRLIPNYVYAYYYRGKSYDSLGLHQRATEDYNEAIRFGFRQDLEQ